jgi:hypothetical protein
LGERGRFLTHGQRPVKNPGLVDDVAPPEMADRNDKTGTTVAIAKFELARIRPSAAVPFLGMGPEPASIKPDDLSQRTRHCDGALPQMCGRPSTAGHTNGDLGKRTTSNHKPLVSITASGIKP